MSMRKVEKCNVEKWTVELDPVERCGASCVNFAMFPARLKAGCCAVCQVGEDIDRMLRESSTTCGMV